jgi:hypothetical protein
MNGLRAIHEPESISDTVAGKWSLAPPSEHRSKPMYTAHSHGGGRIFCWIMTNPKNHATKGIAVRDTWGRHCDLLKFATTEPYSGLDTWILDIGQCGGGEERRGSA